MNKTTISSILNDIKDGKSKEANVSKIRDLKNLDIDDLIDDFQDGSQTFGERKRVFVEISTRNPEIANESLTNLCRNFQQTGSQDLLNFICFMIDYTSMDIFMKFECVLTLYNSHLYKITNDQKQAEKESYEKSKGYLLQILKEYCLQSEKTRPSITIFIDILRYLIIQPSDDRLVHIHIEWFLTQSGLTPDFIYKTILSIDRDVDRPADKHYRDYFYIRFFNSTPSSRHKILAAQYILKNGKDIIGYGDIKNTENILLDIAKDEKEDYNTRADSADVLIHLGNDQIKHRAKAIIAELGKDLTSVKTVYTNKQNVHVVEESVMKFLLTLGGTKLETIKDANDSVERCVTFDEIVTKFLDYIHASKYASKIEQINSSLLRIKIDQIIYPGSQNLATIFIKIFSLIQKHLERALLLDRLAEELIDMDETCSSGHASRLVNVFSGVDGFNLDIGFASQIQSNIVGRLQKIIKDEPDREYASAVLEEMMDNDQDMEQLKPRHNFNRFFREHIDSIRNELYVEFVDGKYLDKDEFELMFRRGISFFETGSNV